MVTLKQIAQVCNVSVTTVSRVLSDDQTLSVSKANRLKIQRVAKDMGYAKKHKNHQNHLHIAIVLWYDPKQEIEDPYYMEIRHGIEKQAKEKGIYIMTLYRHDAKFNLDQLSNIDGLIALGKFSASEIRAFEKKTKHIVFVDSDPDSHRFDCVIIDFEKALDDIAAHLFTTGYQTVGYIGGYENNDDKAAVIETREKLLKKHLKAHACYDETHVHRGFFTSESGYALMRKAIDAKTLADVYFCANDSIAIGAMKALHETNLNIPKDVAIIGFNDIAQARYIHPSLTTLRVETTAMGQEALLSLLQRINHPKKLPIKKVVPTTLIKRQSA